MIISAFGMSVTTFVGQNYGAGKWERVRKGIRVCTAMTFGAAVVLSLLLYCFGSYFYHLFTTDGDVIQIGINMLRYLVPVYFTYVAIEIFSGALRGVGDCWIPMLLSCGGICVIRFLWILIAVPMHRDIYHIMFSYPLTWAVTSILFVAYYFLFSKLKIFYSKMNCDVLI